MFGLATLMPKGQRATICNNLQHKTKDVKPASGPRLPNRQPESEVEMEIQLAILVSLLPQFPAWDRTTAKQLLPATFTDPAVLSVGFALLPNPFRYTDI